MLVKFLLMHIYRRKFIYGKCFTSYMGNGIGGIGFGFFLYRKKQKAVVPFAIGILLFVFPYFISNVYMLVIVGMVLVVLPYFLRI